MKRGACKNLHSSNLIGFVKPCEQVSRPAVRFMHHAFSGVSRPSPGELGVPL